MNMFECCKGHEAETTGDDGQSLASVFWGRVAPELSEAERKLISGIFKLSRQTNYRPMIWKLCEQINLSHKWDGATRGFTASSFSRIVFMGGE